MTARATSPSPLRSLVEEYALTEKQIRLGGGVAAIERQHEKGRLTARERVDRLLDPPVGSESRPTRFMELGLWAAHGMYKEYGGAPAAGVVTAIGAVQGRRCMIIANDATVKAGAFFPMTCKKIIRAQTIAMMARLPLIYLVDSAGVFLPLQEDVFPDTDDFGRIFRNNAVISAEGIPQVAAIMGYCVAGGGYLPVLCDTLLMTEGSGLYLAGPALVKAAIGQDVTDEELGGAEMHAAVSGTIDFKEKDDGACIERLKSLMAKYPGGPPPRGGSDEPEAQARERARSASEGSRPADDVYDVFSDKPGSQYDVRDVIACIVDARNEPGASATGFGAPEESPRSRSGLVPDFDEYKPNYGQSIVCGYASIGGHACGVVANQKKLVQRTLAGVGRHSVPPRSTVGSESRPTQKASQMPGVIYDDSADKAARFIMDCNQRKIPIIFLHDTTGFMVGRDSEQGGIIRAGAKMVNAVSNSVVPKISVILGGSYGAGHYAMCGRAFDPFLTLAWPGARYAVMGASQATGTLAMIEEKARERRGENIDEDAHRQILAAVHASYTEQADVRHAAARGWVDRIIEPHRTRDELITALAAAAGWDYSRPFKTGVLQT